MIERNIIFPLALVCALGLSGCDGLSDAAKTSAGSAAHSQGAGAEQARTSLLERDLAFGNAVAEFGLAEAYRLFLAEDAVQLPDGDRPLQGRTAIYEQIIDATRDSDFLLSWRPEVAEVSLSGDLGYTWGTYWLELLDEEGNPVVLDGNYVNVWRKSATGVWEVIVDISNQIATDYVPTAPIDVDEPDAASDSE
jgi:ketosteroid isomerase-like protein